MMVDFMRIFAPKKWITLSFYLSSGLFFISTRNGIQLEHEVLTIIRPFVCANYFLSLQI